MGMYMKRIISTFVFAAVVLPGAVYAEKGKIHKEIDVEQKADGSYEGTATTEAVDAAGTSHKSKTKEKVSNSANGQKRFVKSETQTDPKGLGNKTWSKKEVTTDHDANGEQDDKVVAKSVDQAGTGHETTTEVEKDVKSDGTVEVTKNEKTVTDPKGLMNKTTSETETTVNQGVDGSTSTTVEKKVDGKTVDKTVR